MIFAATFAIVFALGCIVGWFLVSFSHLGGNSRPPAMREFLFAAIVAAIFAGLVVHHAVHFISWLWSLL